MTNNVNITNATPTSAALDAAKEAVIENLKYLVPAAAVATAVCGVIGGKEAAILAAKRAAIICTGYVVLDAAYYGQQAYSETKKMMLEAIPKNEDYDYDL